MPRVQSNTVCKHTDTHPHTNPRPGLISRYALGSLFNPASGTIAGLQPAHFITLATPHFGWVGTLQLVAAGAALPACSSLRAVGCRAALVLVLLDRAPPLFFIGWSGDLPQQQSCITPTHFLHIVLANAGVTPRACRLCPSSAGVVTCRCWAAPSRASSHRWRTRPAPRCSREQVRAHVRERLHIVHMQSAFWLACV